MNLFTAPILFAPVAGAAGLAAALMTVAVPAQAAAPTHGKAAIEARYQADRKACLEGRTGQDRATCLKEAGAVRAESLRHPGGAHSAQADAQALQANALKRCEVHAPSERQACETLARGQGMESGSVRDGGVIKEVVTRSVGQPRPAH